MRQPTYLNAILTVNAGLLARCRSSAMLINAGRGALVVDADLAAAPFFCFFWETNCSMAI